MWNRHSMYYWRVYDNGAFTEIPCSDSRSIFIEALKVHDDDGEETFFWEVGEHWWALTDQECKYGNNTFFLKEKHEISMLLFNTPTEARMFVTILAEVLNCSNENEICSMLSRYVLGKLIQANPEKIQRLKEEEELYRITLEEKRKWERENAKALAKKEKLQRRLEKLNGTGATAHVYIFLFDENFCKIGMSQNVENRRRTKINETGRAISQWCYTKQIPRGSAEEIEAKCHAHFKGFRTYGEFFTITFDEACAYLQSLVKAPLIFSREERK